MGIFKSLAFLGMMFFAFFGAVFFSTIAHELYHYHDFDEITNSKELCFFSINLEKENLTWSTFDESMRGYYRYTYQEENKDEITEKTRHAELRANLVQGSVGLIFVICFFIFLWERKDFKENELFYK